MPFALITVATSLLNSFGSFKLICRRVFRTIHHKDLNWCLLHLSFKPSWSTDANKEGPASGHSNVLIVEPVEPGLIHDWTTQRIGEHIHQHTERRRLKNRPSFAARADAGTARMYRQIQHTPPFIHSSWRRRRNAQWG